MSPACPAPGGTTPPWGDNITVGGGGFSFCGARRSKTFIVQRSRARSGWLHPRRAARARGARARREIDHGDAETRRGNFCFAEPAFLGRRSAKTVARARASAAGKARSVGIFEVRRSWNADDHKKKKK